MKHKRRLFPHIVAVREFRDVLPKVFAADVNVSAFDAVLEAGPIPFYRVNVPLATYILANTMIDGAVIVASF